MARVRKVEPTLEALFFSTPEQKVLRYLLSEPTTSFTPRILSSKLKGVRGLGGAEGLNRILLDLETLGLVEFLDNRRSVRIQEDHPSLCILKTFSAMCDLEGLRKQLEPVSSKGILFGSRATGLCHSSSDYDLLVVSHTPDEVKNITSRHPLGRQIELVACTPDSYIAIDRQNPDLRQRLATGIVLWGPN